ncbi:MAG: hypothetical protein JWN60_2291, partial [Acidobacteria bacterium]|nr:hypothetical protein [Acidobacteriota bacterium]
MKTLLPLFIIILTLTASSYAQNCTATLSHTNTTT